MNFFTAFCSVVMAIIAIYMYFGLSGISQKELTERVSGKRVVVTGASLGIGREIVKEYADLGASDIVLVARSEEKLESLREEVNAAFDEIQSFSRPKIHVLPADLSTEETCKHVVDVSLKMMGGIDYLVLNHITNSQYGLWTGKEFFLKKFPPSLLTYITPEKDNHDFVSHLISVNTLSYIWLATEALPSLEKSGGQILVVSSFAGLKIILFLDVKCQLTSFTKVG